MKTIIINRDWSDVNQSLGVAYIKDEEGIIIFKAESLERGSNNNQKNISCIPAGTYPVKLEYSPRFKKDLYEIYNVPDRSECKFHSANFWQELEGCVALGSKRKNINDDKYLDVTNSRNTMKAFHAAMNGDLFAKVIISDLFTN